MVDLVGFFSWKSVLHVIYALIGSISFYIYVFEKPEILGDFVLLKLSDFMKNVLIVIYKDSTVFELFILYMYLFQAQQILYKTKNDCLQNGSRL